MQHCREDATLGRIQSQSGCGKCAKVEGGYQLEVPWRLSATAQWKIGNVGLGGRSLTMDQQGINCALKRKKSRRTSWYVQF